MNPARFMIQATHVPDGLAAEAVEYAPWFHNLHLPDGGQTAPGHPLGDFPSDQWWQIAPHLPLDLTGWSVLDVGCNAGFYSFELAKRGAYVTAVEPDPHFLSQAKWAARQFGLEGRISFRNTGVYELARSAEVYDLVLFMGVFYHLRHPLLALDILAAKTRQLMVFQSLTMPGDAVFGTPPDLEFDHREVMLCDGWPKMAFIEKSLAGDPTNWWAPNHACVEAMLRSSGMEVISRPGLEVYLCVLGHHQSEEEADRNRAELAAVIGCERPT